MGGCQNKSSRSSDNTSNFELNLPGELNSMATKWTSTETELLIQVRERLKDKLNNRPQYPEVVGDRKLIRFLRGHGHNLDKACEMIESFLDWRIEFKVDEIRNNIVEGGINCLSKFPYADKILKIYLVLALDLACLSHAGEPVSGESTLPPEIWDTVSLDEYIIFRIYCLELVSLMLEQISHNKEKEILESGGEISSPFGYIQQIQVIRDVKNLGWTTFAGTTREAFQKVTKMSSDNYPEVLKKCHVINAPWIFGGIWNIAKIFMAPTTIAKVSILGNDYMDKITDDIPKSNIPTFLGGSFEVKYDVPFSFDTIEGGALYYTPTPTPAVLGEKQLESSTTPPLSEIIP